MSEVTLTIGRRGYTVACADGQEAHVRAMGAEVDERLRRVGALSPNDAKNMLFAALILADELFEERRKAGPSVDARNGSISGELVEAKTRLAIVEEELADAHEEAERLRQHLANANERLARAYGDGDAAGDDEKLAQRLEQLAHVLEKSAAVLERGDEAH